MENTVIGVETAVEGDGAAVEVAEVATAQERMSFKLDDGTEGSRSAYIRQEFKKDRSRAEIAKELDVPYYTIYSATANMFNAVHKEGQGNTGVRGEMVEYDGEIIPRAEAMRRDARTGMSRSEIAKKYDTPYATVFAATKGEDFPEGAKKGKVVMPDPRTGENKPRVEIIREMYEEGKGKEGIRREIANLLGCDYAVVWAATKDSKESKEDGALSEDVAVDQMAAVNAVVQEAIQDIQGEIPDQEE